MLNLFTEHTPSKLSHEAPKGINKPLKDIYGVLRAVEHVTQNFVVEQVHRPKGNILLTIFPDEADDFLKFIIVMQKQNMLRRPIAHFLKSSKTLLKVRS